MKKITLLLTTLLILPLTQGIQIEAVSTDPAFLSAGMDATIAVTLYERGTDDENRGRYTARLKPGNRLAENHVRIVDDETTQVGYLPTGTSFVTQHRIRILSDAPTGTYSFDVVLQDERRQSTIIKPITIHVEQEGVSVDTTLIQTEPRKLRPGDNTAHATVRVTNNGEVPVEDIVLRPSFPEHISPLYSEDEKIRLASLGIDEYQDVTIGFDVDKQTTQGRKPMTLLSTFEDDEGNTFEDTNTVPLRIEGRPLLKLQETTQTMKAGETKNMNVNITNTGSQDAESVEARLILQQGQPFTPTDRSVYIGRIQPNETKQAMFTVTTDSTTPQQEHNLEVELRGNGERSQGDTNVYIERETTTITIDGETTNPLIPIGAGALALILIGILTKYVTRKGSEKNE